jgi:hypothetical protein
VIGEAILTNTTLVSDNFSLITFYNGNELNLDVRFTGGDPNSAYDSVHRTSPVGLIGVGSHLPFEPLTSEPTYPDLPHKRVSYKAFSLPLVVASGGLVLMGAVMLAIMKWKYEKEAPRAQLELYDSQGGEHGEDPDEHKDQEDGSDGKIEGELPESPYDQREDEWVRRATL